MEREPLHHTGHLIRRAQQLHVALWNAEVSTRVSSVQFAALVTLRQRPGISQRELGADLDLDRSTIADIVERMIARGLISRERSSADRRRMALDLTDDGVAALREMEPRVDLVQLLLTECLEPEELAAFRRLLRKVLTHGIEHGRLQGRLPAEETEASRPPPPGREPTSPTPQTHGGT